MLSDQAALQKELIGWNAGAFGTSRDLAQSLRWVSVMGQEADLHRQNG
jgi:hypothetical protein